MVGLDGSKNSIRALEAAIHQAKIHEASITGIYVFPHTPDQYYWRLGTLEKTVKTSSSKVFGLAHTKSKKEEIPFKGKLAKGDPGSYIIKFASEGNFDLIVLGSRGKNTLKSILLGSVSDYVVHKSKIPILIIK